MIQSTNEKMEIPAFWFIKNKYPEVRRYLSDRYSCPSVLTWNYDYIGYDDASSSYNGLHGATYTDSFYNNAIEITYPEFCIYFLGQEVDNNLLIFN